MSPFVFDLATLAGITVGLVQVVKQAVNFNDRFSPLLDVLIGIGLALLFVSVTRQSAMLGLFAGLSSAGLFNGVKTVAGRGSVGTAQSTSINVVGGAV